MNEDDKLKKSSLYNNCILFKIQNRVLFFKYLLFDGCIFERKLCKHRSSTSSQIKANSRYWAHQ